MIRIHVPTGLPAESGGRLEFHTVEVPHVPGRKLTEYVQLKPEEIDRVIHKGRALSAERGAEKHYLPESRWRWALRKLRGGERPFIWVPTPSEIEMVTPNDGDEFHVIPKVGGKNAGIIGGVVGAVVGVALFIATGGASSGLSIALIQAAMTGFAIGSAIGAFFIPKPKMQKSGDDALTSHAWQGITNEDRAGVPKPVPFGRHKTGGVRISTFIKRDGDKEYLYMQLLVSNGQISAINDVRLNDQPYTNFPGVTIEKRLGTDDQTVMKGFNVVANTYQQNPPVKLTTTPYTYLTADSLDAYEILLNIPGLCHVNKEGQLKENKTRFRYRHREYGTTPWGDWTEKEVTGSTRTILYHTIRVEVPTRARYEVQVQFVSANKTEPDRSLWDIYLTGVTEEKDEDRAYPGHGLIGIKALASDQLGGGGIPTITSVVDGLVVQQWNGFSFDPPTWTNNPAWIVLEIFRNEKWGAGTHMRNRDIADRNSASAWPWIDLNSFKAWADYNDELVVAETETRTIIAATANSVMLDAPVIVPPGLTYGFGMRVTHPTGGFDIRTVTQGAGTYTTLTPTVPFSKIPEIGDTMGFGALEKRHELNIVLNQRQNFLDLVMDLCGTARCAPVMSGNKWRMAIEKPSQPVQLFTMGNIVRDSFNISYRSDKDRVNTFDVQFINAARNYDTDSVEIASKQEVDVLGKPVKRGTLQVFGVTRISQVIREARFRLNSGHYLRRLITFTASTDSILIEAGDVFLFQHELPQWGFGGRLMDSTSATHVWVDQPLEMAGGGNYELRVRPSDGSNDLGEVKTVVNNVPAGEVWTVNELDVTTPFSFVPQNGDLYSFGPTKLDSKPYRCLSITRSGEGSRRITALEYNESIVDDSGEVIITQNSLLPDFGAPPAPILDAVAFEEVKLQADESWTSTIILQWSRPSANYIEPPPPGGPTLTPSTRRWGLYRGAKVERSWNGTNWEDLASVDGTEYRWEDAPQGVDIWFRVTPYSTSGKYNLAGAKVCDPAPLHTMGNTIRPPAVANFRGTVIDNQYVFQWDETGRSLQYEIRKSASGNWGFGTQLFGRVASYTPPTATTEGSLTITTDLVSGDSQTLTLRAGTTVQNSGLLTPATEVTVYYNIDPNNIAYGTVRAESGDTRNANGLVWRGRGQRFAFLPSNVATDALYGRNHMLYIKALDDFNNSSFGAVGAALNDTAPAAPIILTVRRYRNSLRVKVSPPAGVTDITGMHLHASQTPGFVPSPANRVSGLVGPHGGEFDFAIAPGTTGNWYFKATASDWLSQRLGDWIYSAEAAGSGTYISITHPEDVYLPTVAEMDAETEDQGFRPRQWREDENGDLQVFRTPRPFVSWKHPGNGGRVGTGTIAISAGVVVGTGTQFTKDFEVGGILAPLGSPWNAAWPQSYRIITAVNSDTSMTVQNPVGSVDIPAGRGYWIGNPTGSLLGFHVVLIDGDLDEDGLLDGDLSEALKTPLFESALLPPDRNRYTFHGIDVPADEMAVAAVKAIYIDGMESFWVTSNGQTIGPENTGGLGPAIAAELEKIALPSAAWDFFPLIRDANGVRGAMPKAGGVYALEGYGAVLESATANQYINAFDLTTWLNDATCTVTKVTNGAVLPPINGDWDVYKITKTGAAGAGYIYKSFLSGGNSRPWNASLWVNNGRNNDADYYTYLYSTYGTGFSGGHQSFLIAPGAWRRIQTASFALWSGADLGSTIYVVFRSDGMQPGDFFYAAVPSLTSDYFAKAGTKVARALSELRYDAGPAKGDNWCAMWVAKPLPQSIPRLLGGATITMMDVVTASNVTVAAAEITGGASGILKARIRTRGGAATDLVSAEVNVPAGDEHVWALRRQGAAFELWVDGAKLVDFTPATDPTATVIPDALVLGLDPAVTSTISNMLFRNLTVFMDARTDEEIRTYSKLKLNFLPPDTKIVVPKPSLVGPLSEVI